MSREREINSYYTEHAKKFGVNSATILYNMIFWIKKNYDNRSEKHYHNGKYWTYNSLRAFERQFPQFTKRQIEHAINKLLKCGAIERSVVFNNKKYDSTSWYTIKDDAMYKLEIGILSQRCDGTCHNGVPDLSQKCDGTCHKNVTIRPDIIITDINTDKEPPISPKGDSERLDLFQGDSLHVITKHQTQPRVDAKKELSDETFKQFWKLYPKKVGKQPARKAWNKIKDPIKTLEQIKDKLATQKTCRQWTESNGKYIPNPTTYINQERWEDETPQQSQQLQQLHQQDTSEIEALLYKITRKDYNV